MGILLPALVAAAAAVVAEGADPAVTQSSNAAQYWWYYPDSDCGYDDVPGNCTGQTVDGCKATCLATSGCGGFNYPHGILKKTSCLSKMGKQGSVDLYVLEATPQPPPPLPKWGELWPIPQNYSFDRSGQLNLAAVFKITTTASSARLARGITRYESIIKTAATPPSGGDFDGVRTGVAVATLPTLTVAVTTHDDDELPTKTTDYSYTLTVTSTPTPSAVVTAASVYGAIYGLETFSQLVQAGGLINASEVKVEDSPTFEHRSFMADTGRRFWPVKTVEALMDGMAANKMNVLHLHLSDNCRYAAPSAKFPSLTNRLTGILGGFYSAADVAELVAYGADRGIRIIPEADLPGHSEGMQGLSGKGLVFCNPNGTAAFSDLRNDADGQTIATVKAMYDELASLFPAAELFIGADEVRNNGPCTMSDYQAIETALTEHITGPSLNRAVGGWEEYGFETGVAKANNPDYWVNSWHYHTQFESTARGFLTVASNDSHFYLLYGQPAEKYWVDIADGLNDTQRSLLMGGSVSAWGDEYCYIAYCIHPGQYPSAHALFPPSADDLFHQSIIGYSFPRTIMAAGSFWNYSPELNVSSSDFTTTYHMANERLIARGVPSCPSECHCDASTRCGKKYAPETEESPPTLSLEELLELHPDPKRRGLLPSA